MDVRWSNALRWLVVGLAALALVACGPDDEDDGEEPDASADATADVSMDDGGGPDDATDDTGTPDTTADIGGDAGMDADTDGSPEATEFQVTLENVSDASGFPTPFAPGAWAVHAEANPLFETNTTDRPDGLETLAEDGGGSSLAESIAGSEGVSETGTFGSEGPVTPGNSTSFTVEAAPEDGALSFASMFVQSNDVFVAPGSDGIELFDEEGMPFGERDVTDQLAFYDAGTERNQAPGFGRDQAPRQESAGDGAEEGVVSEFNGATRALPHAHGLAFLNVQESDGTFTFELLNISGTTSGVDSPIAPVFYARHDSSWSLFSPGSEAGAPLETLAEDGSPSDLVSEHAETDGVATAAAAATPVDGSEEGPAPPGDSFRFEVEPSEDASTLSFAAMLVESNDAFLALRGSGVELMSDGEPRSVGEVETEIRRRLAVWDAGTEQNQVPGVGSNQPPRQEEAGAGPEDPDSEIRLYRDSTNDLSGEMAGGFLEISVEHGDADSDFEVTVTNTSDSIAYTGSLSPLAWATTDGETTLFETGDQASDGLESLAEDGMAGELADELFAGVGESGVASTPAGADEAGPIMPGDSYEFTVTPDADHRYLNLASMVIPSNDTFVALGETGVALLDSDGNRRDASAVGDDITDTLAAYNAGTEADQAGAIGLDQPPRQDGADTGPAEGDGSVRELDDPVWSYPTVEEALTVTVEPM